MRNIFHSLPRFFVYILNDSKESITLNLDHFTLQVTLLFIKEPAIEFRNFELNK